MSKNIYNINNDFRQKNNPILKEIAKEIEGPFEDLYKIQRKMAVLVRKYNALGVAAPQIGHSIRLIVVRVQNRIISMVNPEIIEKSIDKDIKSESCFSVDAAAKKYMKKRSKQITVKYLDMKGFCIQSNFLEMDARIIQHEIDHLNGILINE